MLYSRGLVDALIVSVYNMANVSETGTTQKRPGLNPFLSAAANQEYDLSRHRGPVSHDVLFLMLRRKLMHYVLDGNIS